MDQSITTAAASPAHRELLADFLRGSRTALARVISIVENARPGFEPLLNALHPRIGKAQRIGVTGPPGAGKSTLTAALISAFRGRGQTVGVVAVDPSSPFTGGALLGDRIRMNEVATDPAVFIRSMASRGSHGGLASATRDVADVMDAFGFDYLIIETVGVGQAELDIAAAADSTVVVLVPESGDSIQAMKAGLMEISDIFVINKADRPGADRMAREIEMMLRLRTGESLFGVKAHHGVALDRLAGGAPTVVGPAAVASPTEADTREPWTIPVLQTNSETSDGVPDLVEAIDRHRSWLDESGELQLRRRERLAGRVRDIVSRDLLHFVWAERGGESLLERELEALERGEVTPYRLASEIVRRGTG